MSNTNISLALDSIHLQAERKRKLRPETVRELGESMGAQGQLQSIIVRPRAEGGYWLVVGLHRVAAARKLKWKVLRATVLDLNTDQAELVEIDENLIRADLTPVERAMHMARRKELYEKAHPETKPTKEGGPGRAKTRRQNGDDAADRFTKDAASNIGKSERSVQRDVERGKKIPVLDEIKGTCLDKKGELDALAKLPADEQRALAAAVKAGETVSAKARLAQLDDQKPERKPQKTAGQHVITAEERMAAYAAAEQQQVNSVEAHADFSTPPQLPASKPINGPQPAPIPPPLDPVSAFDQAMATLKQLVTKSAAQFRQHCPFHP
jgi:ParB-like chromosome segregation protein Spo0J